MAEWVARYRRLQAPALRLFCFPHAGGGAAWFSRWAQSLPPDVDACGIRLPGRESRLREPPLTAMDDVVAALAPALGPLLDLPFAFYGFCSGSLVAFELARRLRRRGAQLPALLVAAHLGAPESLAAAIADGLARQGRADGLSAVQLVEMLAQAGGIPPALREIPALFPLVERAIRADGRLLATYRYVPEAPLPVPISVFGARCDPHVGLDALVAWHGHTTGPFSLRLLEGGHFRMEAALPAFTEALVADVRMAAAG